MLQHNMSKTLSISLVTVPQSIIVSKSTGMPKYPKEEHVQSITPIFMQWQQGFHLISDLGNVKKSLIQIYNRRTVTKKRKKSSYYSTSWSHLLFLDFGHVMLLDIWHFIQHIGTKLSVCWTYLTTPYATILSMKWSLLILESMIKDSQRLGQK